MTEDPQPTVAATLIARFDAFYLATVQPLYRFIFSRVMNREEAEDLTAQVFMKALRGADWTRDDTTIRHWCFQVAQTVISDHWRATGRLTTTSLDRLLGAGWAGPANPIAAHESHDETETVEAILVRLPPAQSAVLRCRFLWQMSIKETAASLHISEANAKVIQYRALKRAAELRDQHAQRAEVATDERSK